MHTDVMTLQVLAARVRGLRVPNWVRFTLDDHRPELLAEVELGDTPNPYTDIRAIRLLTKD